MDLIWGPPSFLLYKSILYFLLSRELWMTYFMVTLLDLSLWKGFNEKTCCPLLFSLGISRTIVRAIIYHFPMTLILCSLIVWGPAAVSVKVLITTCKMNHMFILKHVRMKSNYVTKMKGRFVFLWNKHYMRLPFDFTEQQLKYILIQDIYFMVTKCFLNWRKRQRISGTPHSTLELMSCKPQTKSDDWM